MNTKFSFSGIMLKSLKLSFCTGGQLEIAMVILVNVNFHRERKPAKSLRKCNLMSFSVRGQGNINGDAF